MIISFMTKILRFLLLILIFGVIIYHCIFCNSTYIGDFLNNTTIHENSMSVINFDLPATNYINDMYDMYNLSNSTVKFRDEYIQEHVIKYDKLYDKLYNQLYNDSIKNTNDNIIEFNTNNLIEFSTNDLSDIDNMKAVNVVINEILRNRSDNIQVLEKKHSEQIQHILNKLEDINKLIDLGLIKDNLINNEDKTNNTNNFNDINEKDMSTWECIFNVF